MAKQTQPADFYVSFGGTHGQSNVDEPKLGQQVEYTVFGTISKIAEAIRDDGETRLTLTVDVEAAWPKGTKRPDNANQGSMIDHDGKVEPDAAPPTATTVGADPEPAKGDDDGEGTVVAFSDKSK